MDIGRDREEWTDEDERQPEGEPKPMPVQEEGLAVGLEGLDEQDPDLDPDIAEEVRLESETAEAEKHEPAGPLEAALEEAEEEDAAESGDDS
jgi:hypothetical protein